MAEESLEIKKKNDVPAAEVSFSYRNNDINDYSGRNNQVTISVSYNEQLSIENLIGHVGNFGIEYGTENVDLEKTSKCPRPPCPKACPCPSKCKCKK